jgi:hypothetical protein
MVYKRVVYTSIFNGYDNLSPVDPNWSCDFICFTDDPGLRAEGWRIHLISDRETPPSILNRKYKIQPHRFLHGYEVSLYVDGNIQIRSDPTLLFEKYEGYSFAAPMHRDRDCVYVEARTCLDLNLIDFESYEKMVMEYRTVGFPEHYGLTENNVLLRKHGDPLVSRIMDEWWSEFRRWGKRDQTTLPVLLWKHHLIVTPLVEGPRYSDKFFSMNLHAADQNRNFLRRAVRIAQMRRHLALHYRVFSKFARTASAILKFPSRLRCNT